MKRRREDTKESVAINDCHRECQLWTEKYKPRNCAEVIGNRKAVNKLKLWLEDWRKTIDYKSECVDLSNGDDCDQYLDDSKTCVLITGPTGCGKTSMVYAIAEECKFHVLEINGSMKRNGRVVSKMVLEATQSHHMKRCSNPLFPSINRNHIKSDDCVVIEQIIDHKKVNNVNNNNIKNNSKKKSKKAKKDNGLLKYFSVKQNDKTSTNKSNDKVVEVIDISENVSQTNGEHYDCSQTNGVSQNSQQTVAQKSLTITSNSLILFDDVDIMLDDNINGFWSAVNKINEITKIPVILTATQHIPYIRSCVNHLQVLSLDVPDLEESSTALSSIFAKEKNNKHYIVKPKVYEMITNTFSNDMRRCINELQFDSQRWLNNTQSVNTKCGDNNNNKKLISYYDTLIFSDIIENQFNLLSYRENRDLWMKCVPNVMDDDSHTIGLAKDIVFSANKLNGRKDRHSNTLPIKEPSYVEALSKYLSVTTDKKSLHLDYCPYLSYMCEYESIRRSLVANHSRRSRRFMHHFDAIGIYISDSAKTKLISCFDPIRDFEVKIDDENDDDDDSATEIDSSTDIDSSAEND